MFWKKSRMEKWSLKTIQHSWGVPIPGHRRRSPCKGFLNKGFHWPAGPRHAHTAILLPAIPSPPVGQVEKAAVALGERHGLYMAHTSLRIWRNLQGIWCFSTYWHLQSSLNHAWEASGTCSSQNITPSSQGIEADQHSLLEPTVKDSDCEIRTRKAIPRWQP